MTLEIKKVKFSYKNHPVLKDVSLTVPSGSIVALIGANGAGKSTLLRSVMGILSYTGTILYKNQPLTKDVLQEDFEYIPQGNFLMEDITVRDNLTLLKKPHMPPSDWEKLGVESILHKKVKSLSLGQKRRVVLAGALQNRPSFLIMDEPLASLDFIYKEDLLQLLLSLKKTGLGILLTTHQLEGLKYADMVYELKDGISQIHRNNVNKEGESYDKKI